MGTILKDRVALVTGAVGGNWASHFPPPYITGQVMGINGGFYM
jgi:hypothetical protein